MAGYHVEVEYLPCGALGGDFYDFQTMPDGRLLVTLGDVSGKGPAGAIVMAMVQTLFRENLASAAGPADLLCRVNGSALCWRIRARRLWFVEGRTRMSSGAILRRCSTLKNCWRRTKRTPSS